MHIILGLLGSLITVLYLLDRLGVDLGAFNPFYWRRRRAWRAKYEGDPIHAVENPLDVAALFVVGIARIDGDVSTEQKDVAVRQFRDVFKLDDKAAAQLFGSAAYLLGQPQVIESQLEGVAERHIGTFSADQAESLLNMMQAVANADGEPTERQRQILTTVRSKAVPAAPDGGVWEQ